jgi:membrane protein implicated in regulation of membrane protease activity
MAGLEFWHWWAFGGVLLIIEAFAPGFMFLWLGIAAGLVGVVLAVWPELGTGVQLLLYAALSVLSVSG